MHVLENDGGAWIVESGVWIFLLIRDEAGANFEALHGLVDIHIWICVYGQIGH